MNNLINVIAVIPFYNEEKTISQVVEKTLPFVDKIILVDDGSTDNTVKNIPSNEKVILIKNTQNRGKGYSLNQGFKKSFELNSKITLTLDADLQHDPNFIPYFLKKIVNYDIVIGNRMHSLKKMPIQRIMSNKITSFLMTLKTRQKILDSQSGYRAYKTEILPEILPFYNGFEAESEILVNAARKNYKIGFVDIPTIYGEEVSKMKALQTIIGFFKVMLK